MFIFHKQFYFVFPDLKIIGHGNSDNNLESLEFLLESCVSRENIILMSHISCSTWPAVRLLLCP
jgi:hypothetical protein